MVSGTKRSVWRALRQMMKMPSFRPIRLMDDNRGVLGVNLGHLWEQAEKLRGMLGEIVDLTEQGRLEPVVDRSFSFEDAQYAHAYIQERRNFGKVLLAP